MSSTLEKMWKEINYFKEKLSVTWIELNSFVTRNGVTKMISVSQQKIGQFLVFFSSKTQQPVRLRNRDIIQTQFVHHSYPTKWLI